MVKSKEYKEFGMVKSKEYKEFGMVKSKEYKARVLREKKPKALPYKKGEAFPVNYRGFRYIAKFEYELHPSDVINGCRYVVSFPGPSDDGFRLKLRQVVVK